MFGEAVTWSTSLAAASGAAAASARPANARPVSRAVGSERRGMPTNGVGWKMAAKAAPRGDASSMPAGGGGSSDDTAGKLERGEAPVRLVSEPPPEHPLLAQVAEVQARLVPRIAHDPRRARPDG